MQTHSLAAHVTAAVRSQKEGPLSTWGSATLHVPEGPGHTHQCHISFSLRPLTVSTAEALSPATRHRAQVLATPSSVPASGQAGSRTGLPHKGAFV